MMPLIKPRCQLQVKFEKNLRYRTGDIVLFVKKGGLAAHRIIKTKGSSFVLKGDNNAGVDGSFEASDLMGKVEKIIYPEYSINLNSPKNQFIKNLFVLYSRLNLRSPILLNLRRLYKIFFLKNLYRFLLKS